MSNYEEQGIRINEALVELGQAETEGEKRLVLNILLSRVLTAAAVAVIDEWDFENQPALHTIVRVIQEV